MIKSESEYVEIKLSVEKSLFQIPGVQAVSLGCKMAGDRPTGEIAIRATVEKKKARESLTAAEIIPSHYWGIPTDVVEAGQILFMEELGPRHSPHGLEDNKQYRPLQGGCKIAIDSEKLEAWGTLGCMALNISNNKIVGLSAQHLLSFGKDDPIYVYQPLADYASNCCKLRCCNKNIGIVKEGKRDSLVDCAHFELNGTNWKNTILEDVAIKGSHELSLNDIKNGNYEVFKRGKTTGLTAGYVHDLYWSNKDGSLTSQMRIVPKEPNKIFVNSGDSGSVVLSNSTHKVVGLIVQAQLYSYEPEKLNGLANPIKRVEKTLSISIIEEVDAMGGLEDPADRVRRDLEQSERGRNYLQTYDRHLSEVLYLVNRNRRVATVWQRQNGPKIIQHFIEGALGHGVPMPPALEGRSLLFSLDAIAAALLRYGSPDLKADILRVTPEIEEMVGRPFEEIMDRLRRES